MDQIDRIDRKLVQTQEGFIPVSSEPVVYGMSYTVWQEAILERWTDQLLEILCEPCVSVTAVGICKQAQLAPPAPYMSVTEQVSFASLQAPCKGVCNI